MKKRLHFKLTVFLCLMLCSLNLWAQPSANFTVSQTTACVGDTITMTSTSTSSAPIVNYIWSAQGALVEAAQGATLSSFQFVYMNPGTYSLGLIVQDQNGLSSQKSSFDAITVYAKPTANIVSSIISCTLPFEIGYNSTGSSTGSTIQYQWTFPGGSPGGFNGAQKDVLYNTEGSFTATLKVTDVSTGCFSKATRTIVLENFVADFELPTSICKLSSFEIVNTSSSSATQYSWTASSATINNNFTAQPTLSYSTSGTKTITLTATNSLGCTDTETQTILVNELPEVSFTIAEQSGCAPKTISFTNTSPNPTLNYTWDFDDGSSAVAGFNVAPHTYTINNRLFIPTLTVIDNNSCQNTFFGDSIYFFPPEAYFSVSEHQGCAPISVQFTDQSWSVEPIVSWLWNFDDGTTSTLQHPNHSFPCGIYDVTLTITNSNGCSSTVHVGSNSVGGDLTSYPDDIDTINYMVNGITYINRFKDDYLPNNFGYNLLRFGEVLYPDFTISDKLVCQNETINFEAIINPSCPIENPDNDVYYHWSLENYTAASFNHPYFSYVFQDTLHTSTPLDVSLFVDFRGCISPVTYKIDSIYVKGPISKFTTPDLVCSASSIPYTMQTNDLNSIYGHANTVNFDGQDVVLSQDLDDVEVLYLWGDGSTTLITDDAQLEDADKGATTHVYANFGTYNITQIITNHTTQCADTSTSVLKISYIEGDILTDTVCLYQDYKVVVSGETFNQHLPFSYSISNSTENYSYTSGNDTVFVPNGLNYLNATTVGSEQINLQITNSAGCVYNTSKTLTTLNLPQANISFLEDTVCNNATVFVSPLGSIYGDVTNWSNFSWYDKDTNLITTTQSLDSIPFTVDEKLVLLLKVTDAFGCSSLDYEKITIYTQELEANFVTNPYLCNNVNELLDATSTEGVGNLTYTWFLNGNQFEQTSFDTTHHTIVVSPPDVLLQNYTYSLVVTDTKGCSDSVAYDVIVSNPRITNVDTTIFATYVDINGNFTCPPVVVDFSLDYQTNFTASNYKWSFANDFDDDFDSQNATPMGIQYVQAGVYDLIVQMTESVTGCVFDYHQAAFLTIGGPTAEVLIEPNPNDLCGLSYLFQVINPSDNLDRWDWNLGDGTIEHSENHPNNSFIYTYLSQEDFNPIITIYDDSLQCAIPITVKFDMVENGLDAYFTLSPDEPVVDLNMTMIDGSTSTQAPIVTWIWDFGDGDSTIMNSNANTNHVYLDENTAQITLTIIDQNGCTDQYTLPIQLFKVNFELPNIITNPGGNGQNSNFVLFTDIFSDYHLIIVNRWGNVVHDGHKDPQNPLLLWNGLDHLTDKPCVDGTYFYILEGLLKNGKAIKFQDFLTISGSKG